ncbi:uncharacterized protein MONBRDRAFT_26624 [Monosiga brevicollis MX1]|uniref:Uncharacterized protein n=1 Tax=Monosiga brevicollis TaxID=81824 RepID=A9V2W8_MONBE|nr:uncharacterized protein MONBRDRAFT_26624 [Monosiga brevicollis MX1]EDQ88086.1 predicted protein [Monosiga brevicollis MX1]|eukprot:XP_001747162.1 hypothetical protein [Monosiga brevicollis MX1]
MMMTIDVKDFYIQGREGGRRSRVVNQDGMALSIVAQTFECMYLEQFKLQQMAAVILPLLSDVICWFHYPCLDAILKASPEQHDNALLPTAGYLPKAYHACPAFLAWM